jgi:microcystin degradation protein MlrC
MAFSWLYANHGVHGTSFVTQPRGMKPFNILVGAIGHESNTFAPYMTQLDDFTPRFGAESLKPPFHQAAYAGIVQTLQDHRSTLVPTVDAHALPGGLVERSAYDRLAQAVMEQATPDLDGVCLFLHGAMRASGIDSCESKLLESLRLSVGPDVPISIALDMHGNVTQSMVETVDTMVGFHTAPHIDEFETGVKAAQMLLAMLEDRACPQIGFAKIPFLLPGEKAQTSQEPMAEIMRHVAELEKQPGILSASLLNAHCWADVPDLGVAAVVVSDGDQFLAQAKADRLAASVWAKREHFDFGSEAYSINKAIDVALNASESTIFLSDSGDNPGAGGTTDVPVLLERLLAHHAQRTLVAAIWDDAAVMACQCVGAGNPIELELGGRLDRINGKPLPIAGTIKKLWPRITDTGAAYPVNVSHLAMVGINGIDVLLSSARISIEEPDHLLSLGIDPLAYHLVVLKRGYLTASLEAISPRSILAITPGATCCDLTHLAYKRIARPTYPLASLSE